MTLLQKMGVVYSFTSSVGYGVFTPLFERRVSVTINPNARYWPPIWKMGLTNSHLPSRHTDFLGNPPAHALGVQLFTTRLRISKCAATKEERQNLESIHYEGADVKDDQE
jgi:hypothetical protein